MLTQDYESTAHLYGVDPSGYERPLNRPLQSSPPPTPSGDFYPTGSSSLYTSLRSTSVLTWLVLGVLFLLFVLTVVLLWRA